MEIDLNISALPDPSNFIAACETEDEIGCVLRLHLAFEKIIDFYISNKASDEVLKFVEKTNEFSEKLKRAVLLGLPLTVAKVGQQLGQIRNKVAHEQTPINRHRLENLIKLVDEMLVDGSNPGPVSARKLEMPVKMPGETITLGSHGDMYDFMLTAGTACHHAYLVIARDAAKTAAKRLLENNLAANSQ